MKDKKWIFFIIVAVLLLVIPIPTGVYNDGGTKTYTALTYKIVDWNRLLGVDGTYSKTKVYPFPLNFFSIDSLWGRENVEATENKNVFFNAQVLEVKEKSIIVKPDAESDEFKSADMFSVAVNFEDIPKIKKGDKIRIVYNGKIAESYPAQISALGVYLLGENGEVVSNTPPTE